MGPTELDAYLRRHTEHEDLYAEGWVNPATTRLIRDRDPDRPRIDLSDLGDLSSTKYFFKKHSRFNDYPEHVQEWVELEYQYAGSCVVYVEGNPVELREGQSLLLDQNTLRKPPILGEDQILINFILAPDSIAQLLDRAEPGGSALGDFLINTLRQEAQKNSCVFFASEDS